MSCCPYCSVMDEISSLGQSRRCFLVIPKLSSGLPGASANYDDRIPSYPPYSAYFRLMKLVLRAHISTSYIAFRFKRSFDRSFQFFSSPEARDCPPMSQNIIVLQFPPTTKVWDWTLFYSKSTDASSQARCCESEYERSFGPPLLSLEISLAGAMVARKTSHLFCVFPKSLQKSWGCRLKSYVGQFSDVFADSSGWCTTFSLFPILCF